MPVWLRALFQILRLLTVIERPKEVGNSLTLFYKAPIPFRGSTLKTQQLPKIPHLIISSESQDFYPMNLGMIHSDRSMRIKQDQQKSYRYSIRYWQTKGEFMPQSLTSLKMPVVGTFLVVQWLRLHLPMQGVVGSIPDQGAKISHALEPIKNRT